jgi:hypothetical protein
MHVYGHACTYSRLFVCPSVCLCVCMHHAFYLVLLLAQPELCHLKCAKLPLTSHQFAQLACSPREAHAVADVPLVAYNTVHVERGKPMRHCIHTTYETYEPLYTHICAAKFWFVESLHLQTFLWNHAQETKDKSCTGNKRQIMHRKLMTNHAQETNDVG